MFEKKKAKPVSKYDAERQALHARLDEAAQRLDNVLERLKKGADHVLEKRRLKAAR